MEPSFRSLFLILAAVFVGRGDAFQLAPTFIARHSSQTALHMGALDQQAHESDKAFMRRLMEMASDAASFEKAVMAGDCYDKELALSSKQRQTNGYQRANDTDFPQTKAKNGAYQRVEDWDADRQANGTMTWEEKVQWEGQRNGNRVNQNDILRHHLNTF